MKRIIAIQMFESQIQDLELFRETVQTLTDSGYTLTCITTANQATRLTHISNVQILTVKYFQSHFWLFNYYHFLKLQFTLLFMCVKLLKRSDMLYLHSIFAISPAIVARLKKVKVVERVCVHKKQSGIFHSILRYVVDHTANQLIFPSAELKSQFAAKNGGQTIIYSALSQEFLQKKYRKDEICRRSSESLFNVLMVSYTNDADAFNKFLTLAAMLPGLNFKLNLVEQAKDSSGFVLPVNLMPSNVQIIRKELDESHSTFSDIDAFIDLSSGSAYNESAHVWVLQALHFGVPVIVPQAGYIKELIIVGKNGLAIDNMDLHAISRNLLKLQTDRALYSTIAASCRSRSELFGPDLFRRQLVKLFSICRPDPFEYLSERFGISHLGVKKLELSPVNHPSLS